MICAMTGGVSGVRRQTGKFAPGHYCQLVQDDVTRTIEGPAEQAALTCRLGCLVRIDSVGLGHSMSGVLYR